MKAKITFLPRLKPSLIDNPGEALLSVNDRSYSFKYDKENLSEVYKEIIAKAIELELNRLVIPLLGLDYGISRVDAYNAATGAIEAYLGNSAKLELTLNLYHEDKIASKALLSCASLNGSEEYLADSSQVGPIIPESIKYSVTLNKIFDLMSTREMFIPEAQIDNPMEFIDEYMNEKKIKKSYLYSNGFDKDDCSKCRTGKKLFRKEDCYRAGIVLGLNRTELLQLMSFGGYAFNPNSALDIWFNSYLRENDLAKDMAHFQDLYYDEDDILYRIFNGQ